MMQLLYREYRFQAADGFLRAFCIAIVEQLIDGLEKAILEMKKGEIAEVSLASKYAFVEEHAFPLATVPAGADVVYEIELVDFENPKNHYDLSVPEKLEFAKAQKEKGNKAYKEGKYIRAVAKYEAALKPIEYDKNFDEPLRKETKDIKRSIHLNIAAVALKLDDHKKVISSCGKALEMDPNNIKALYRRSLAYMHQSYFVEAERDIKLAHSLEPDNRDVIAQYKQLRQSMKASSKREAEMYSVMFKRLAQEKETEKEEERPVEEQDPSMIAGPSGEQ